MKIHTLGAGPLLTLPVNGVNNDSDNDYNMAPTLHRLHWARLHKTSLTVTGIRTCTRNLSELR